MINTTSLGPSFSKALSKECFSRERLMPVVFCAFAMLMIAAILAVCHYYGFMTLALFLSGCFGMILFVAVLKNRRQWGKPMTVRASFEEESFKAEAIDPSIDRCIKPITIPYARITGLYPGERMIVLQQGKQFLVLDRNGFEDSDADTFLRFLKEHVSPKAWKYPARARTRSLVAGLSMLLAAIAIMAAAVLFFSNRMDSDPVKQYAALPDGSKADISDVLEYVEQVNGINGLLDPQKQLLQLDEKVYLLITEWDCFASHDDGFLPVLVYRDGDSWQSTVYGHDAVDLTGYCPAANHDIAATFAQEAGSYIILNIGSQYFRSSGQTPETPTDSLGTNSVHLNEQTLGVEGQDNCYWLYLNRQNGNLVCAGTRVSEKFSSDILVIHQMPQDYTVSFGDIELNASTIREYLANPYQGDEPIYAR